MKPTIINFHKSYYDNYNESYDFLLDRLFKVSEFDTWMSKIYFTSSNYYNPDMLGFTVNSRIKSNQSKCRDKMWLRNVFEECDTDFVLDNFK